MNKKVVLSILGVGIIPLLIFYLYASTKVGRLYSGVGIGQSAETIRDLRSELASEISLKNVRYIEGLFKKIESDVLILKFQTELVMSKKDKTLDYIEGLAKRTLITNPNANRVFTITDFLSKNYSRSGISKVNENDKNMFSKLVDIKNNPSKKSIWTEVYSDAKGNKLVSCLVPLYRQNKLEGIIGIEINTEKITNKTINKDFKYKDSYAFVTGSKSIINYPNRALNDLKSDSYKQIENKIFKTKNGEIHVKFNGTDKTIFFTEIYPVKWIFCLVVPDSELELYKVMPSTQEKQAQKFNGKNLFILFIMLTGLTIIICLFVSRRLILAHESELSHLTAKLAIVNQEVGEAKKQMETYEVVKNDKQKLEEEYNRLRESVELKIKNHEEKSIELTNSIAKLKKQIDDADSRIKNYIRIEKENSELKKKVQELEMLQTKVEPKVQQTPDVVQPLIEKVDKPEHRVEPVEIKPQTDAEKIKSLIHPVKEEKKVTKTRIPENQLELAAITDDVLLIESQDGNLRQARSELYRTGYSVHLARGVNDAIDKMSTTPYKFVIMDATLSDDEKKKIRQNIRNVIAITSSIDKEELKRQISELLKHQEE